MVPCAQGRVIVETARPAPPHFATCSTYRRPIVSMPKDIMAGVSGATSLNTTYMDQQSTPSTSRGAISKIILAPPHSTAARPEDLGVTPWYYKEYPTIDTSLGPTGDLSSYPSCSYADKEIIGRTDFISTRNSSMDSEIPRYPLSTAPRKAYMDLTDAIALLDETCPNQEPSPSLTPRTPRTPLTPYMRNKRARSKSSDNSSNYSNDRLSDRSFDTTRPLDKEKKRPFLKKIGISKTEDRPFLAKLAPKIIGKPYLEKIGPSKAFERPFLDKIGSARTVDKRSFDTLRHERKAAKGAVQKSVSKDEATRSVQEAPKHVRIKPEKVTVTIHQFATERRRSGKGPLLKMYSFETEDLESTVQAKEHRDPLRGASLDDVLDSGPSSLPFENTQQEPSKQESEERPSSGAELLKCRVTTSEEIIFSSTGPGSPKESNSWGNSPRKKWRAKKETAVQRTPIHRVAIQNSRESLRNTDSTQNSPIKRPISNVSPDRQVPSQADSLERNIYSPTKTRRQTFDDVLDRNGQDENENKSMKQAQFERRGISSDNLLSKDRALSVTDQMKDRSERTRETSSEDSLARRGNQEYTKETFKQLQDKFKFHEIPTETYADFKRRTRGNLQSSLGRQHDRMKTTFIMDTCENIVKADLTKPEESVKIITSTEATKTEEESCSSVTNEIVRGGTVRSVLRKQEGIDHPSDQESDTNASLRRPKRRIFHEPSQETMDLLTELRKVKSLLKTPSWEKDLELDNKPTRLPKRILLTDKEFCLSVERENSIRRPSKVINTLERTEEGTSCDKEDEKAEEPRDKNSEASEQIEKAERRLPGPALFEKKCLSLDYVDEEKPQKPEPRAISLASARNLPSAAEENVDYSDFALISDSKSYSSDVFNTPSEEANDRQRSCDLDKDIARKINLNHCAEVDIAIPIDQKLSSPNRRVQIQGRTSDLYEIISPRSTPFRVKKRLGKISVEESVKPESFTLGSKVDCRSAVTQKRTKCFPL